MPIATLLLPNFNNERVLPYTFSYLKKYCDCSMLDLLMVDDGSQDDGVRVAKSCAASCGFASIEIIEAKHEGIVAALNRGLSEARTEYILRIDGDATVETPNWPQRMCRYLDNYSEVGMVGAHVIWEDGRVHSFGRSVVSELGLHDIGTAPSEPVGERTFDSLTLRPSGSFSNGRPYEVDTALGVCAAFRRSEAAAVGNFDAKFSPVWIEDDDFGFALRASGLRIIVDPVIHVTHRPSLRGSRNPNEAGRVSSKIYSVAAAILPRRIKGAIRKIVNPSEKALLPKEESMWRVGILQRHYATWKEKWGFDCLNPQMDGIYERYWETPICWKCNPSQLKSSLKFIESLSV